MRVLQFELMKVFKAHRFPFDGLEEGMGHDLHESGLPVAAETIRRIFVQESLQDGGRFHA